MKALKVDTCENGTKWHFDNWQAETNNGENNENNKNNDNLKCENK
jgi:hypothetical protein